jgi:type IV pilus assembly protein PilC
MTVFRYIALQNRQEVTGVVDAPSEQEAVKTLRAQGLFVVSLQSGTQPEPAQLLQWLRRIAPQHWLPVKKQAYTQLYRQLSLMLMSGHTLLEALDLSAQLAERKRLTTVLQTIRSDLQRGHSFAQALQNHARRFPPQVVELVRSAEASGELDQVLLRLAEEQERIIELKRQLITALIYPAIVVCMTIGLLVMMAVWVLPKMRAFIEGRTLNLPASTANMMALSDFVTDHGLTLALACGLQIFAILIAYTTAPGKRVIDRILLSVPLVGKSIVASTMAQTGWTLSMLAASGVTIMDALKICQRITGNEILKTGFGRAAERVLSGSTLSSALRQPAIPELFHKMAAVGEKSGELDRVMNEIGNYYSIELQASLKRTLAVIEPALLLLVGVPVAFVYLSIFQLIFAISTGGR